METTLIKYEDRSVQTLDDVIKIGKIFAESGFFQDSKGAAQAVTKILAGRELGFGPMQSMNGIAIIQNRVAVGAGLMSAAIKRSGKYDYKIRQLDDQACILDFYERDSEGKLENIGESKFTYEDAQAAGLTGKSVWKQYRRNMLFSRAVSNGARWYTPDAFGGPVYTPEELDGEENVPPVSVEKPEGWTPSFEEFMIKMSEMLKLGPEEIKSKLKELGYNSFSSKLAEEMKTALIQQQYKDLDVIDAEVH